MKRLFLLSFLCIYVFALTAQDKTGVGVLIDPKRLTDSYAQQIFKSITDKMDASPRNNYVYYDWAENRNGIYYNPVRNKDKTEQPAELLVFIAPVIQYSKDPKLQFKQDTNGNTVQAYYDVTFNSEAWVKVVDFATSEVVQMKIFKESGNSMSNPSTIDVRDFKKYFGGDPLKIDRKKKAEKLKEIKKDYAPKIKKTYDKAAESISKAMRKVPGWLNGLQDEKLYSMTNVDASSLDKKLVDFEMDGTKEDFLVKYDLFDIYEILEVGGLTTTNRIGSATVREIGETSTKMKTTPFKRKDMAESVKSGRQIYLARNPRALEKFNTANDKKYTIAIDKKCILCDSQFETALNRITNLVIIERAHTNILQTLIERYKKEQFLPFLREGVRRAEGLNEKNNIHIKFITPCCLQQ